MRSVIFGMVVVFGLMVCVVSAGADSKVRFGWVEKVRLYPGDFLIQAKLDTGADNSSLGASRLEEFERDGKPWVRFQVENKYGEVKTFEREVVRVAVVKRHKKKPEWRKVVKMGVCLGNSYQEADINLVDRTNFTYRMLLGRSFLAGHAVLDPGQTFLVEPKCKVPKES